MHRQLPSYLTISKFIPFLKYINNKFTLRFIDTCRFMAFKLSTLPTYLPKILISSKFEKFRETTKHFNTVDIPLFTFKAVYPYELTNTWGKFDETHLSSK